MNDTTKRSIVRCIHLVLAISILGYSYSPFEKLPNYAPTTRFVFVPVMIISGLWMWKGQFVRRVIWKRSLT
jgi:thiosulfate reductase cytochrome b subunit